MSENDLHLPNLTIRRFRGIQDLSIERLGRVTLIAGRNAVGKSTILDAVRAYAMCGSSWILERVLGEREEVSASQDEFGEEVLSPNWAALYYGRHVLAGNPIVLGPKGNSKCLTIRIAPMRMKDADFWKRHLGGRFSPVDARMLYVTFDDKEYDMPLWPSIGLSAQVARTWVPELPYIRCNYLASVAPSNYELARLWHSVALKSDEGRLLEALRPIYGEKIERVAVIGDWKEARDNRRLILRIAGQERPVPLRSLGDGAVRLFGVALALANSQGGFLLIDEAENGIHHTIQRDFWRMVLRTAQENNVQVFATTHSWDCVAGFAQAAVAAEGVAGALVRLDSDGEGIRAVEYSERQLRVAAEQGIEVR